MTTLADIDHPTVTTLTPPGAQQPDEGTNGMETLPALVKQPDELQPADPEQLYLIDQIERFRSGLDDLNPAARKSYAKALVSLENFMRRFSLQYESLTPTLLTDWLITLHLDGITPSTLLLYLNSISSLLTRSGSTQPAAAADDSLTSRISELRALLRSATSGNAAPTATPKPSRKASEPTDADDIDIPLKRAVHRAALLAGGITLEAAARLRRDDLPLLPPQTRRAIEQLAAPYADPRRRYLFPLGQSNRTPRRLVHLLTIKGAPTPGQQWLREAMRLGATPLDAIRALGRNPYPNDTLLTSLIPNTSHLTPPSSLTPNASHLTLTIVEALTANPIHWYALRLRQGVTPRELLDRLKELPGEMEHGDLFYPTHRVAHRTPTGIRHTEEPLLPGILFIRLRVSALPALLHHIGDIAWCYRDPGRRDFGYAPIPDPQMQAFQLAVGVFTEETTVAPLGTIPPRPGQRVIILGGPLTGHTATFMKTKTLPSSPVLYRLTIPGLNGIEWEADLDPRILSLLPTQN